MRDRPDLDVLDALLRRVRISTSHYGRVELGATSGVRVAGGPAASLRHVLEGELWLDVDGHQVRAGTGDLLVLPHGTSHVLRHRPGAIVDGGWPDPGAGTLSTRRRYGGAGPRTVVLCAELGLAGAARAPLLRALPPVVHLPAGDGEALPGLTGLVGLLREEIRASRPGAPLVAARLAELLLLKAVRSELERHAPAGSWRAALGDERVARALDAIFTTPERPWTVASLARVAGMGRATFAQCFRVLVGDTPIASLTWWRMEVAKSALRDEPHRTLADVATAVGYADEFAFASAFRRVVGVAPGAFRAGAG